jgi:ankyrin repeat protein
MFCTTCGKRLSGIEAFCPDCGNIIKTPQPAVPTPKINTVKLKKGEKLYSAINQDDAQKVAEIISSYVIMFNKERSVGETALYLAAKCVNMEILKMIAAASSSVKKGRTFCGNALTFAAHKNHGDMVNHLISIGANLDSKTYEFGRLTPLHKAISEGNLEIAETLISAGADINVLDKDGDSLLFYALGKSGTDKLSFLFAKKIDVDYVFRKSKKGNTILIHSAAAGNAEYAKYLIDIGATVNDSNKYGMTALHYASDNGDIEIARMLIKAGANVNAFTKKYKSTPLHVAAVQDYYEIAGILIAAGANVNALNRNGSTPLHLAAGNGCELTVKLLLMSGAKTGIRNRKGYTAEDVSRNLPTDVHDVLRRQ